MNRALLIGLAFASAICLLASELPEDRTSIFSSSKAASLLGAVCYHVPEGITGYWSPKEQQIPFADGALEKFLQVKSPRRSWDLSKYARQVAGIEVGRKKLIFISYFIFDPKAETAAKKRRFSQFDVDSWDEEPYRVFDGGSDFFRVIYDPIVGSYIWSEFNGNA